MKRTWLGSYPPGVPGEIDPRRCSSLNELFAISFARFRDLPVSDNLGTVITYAQLERLSQAFGAFLIVLGQASSAGIAWRSSSRRRSRRA